MTKGEVATLLKEKGGVRLDIGCGASKQPGFVGIDYQQYGDVDIVHNIEETPWPLPDESVLMAVASHVLEHINPHGGVFINVMDEIWRVLKPGAQFTFVVPYAGSHGYFQDPTHCNPINETTMCYFDPLSPTGLYQFYHPKPWKIEFQAMNRGGTLEVVLSKRAMDSSYEGKIPAQTIIEEQVDAAKEAVRG